jgi:mono/diheme cytochrome c family protein
MASPLHYDGAMRAGVTELKADMSIRSRRSMLETLVRQLHLVRLFAVATAVIALGCTGLVDGGGTEDLTPEQAAAREAWVSEAQPVLAQNCSACHNGSRAGIGFLEGADAMAQRADLLAHDPIVVNLTAPQSSRILTKGLHEGPAFTAAQLSAVLQWIQKQKDAEGTDGGTGPNLETDPFTALICTSGAPGTVDCPYNNVALDKVGVPGGVVRFTVQALGSGLYMSNMKLVPGAEGAYIEHPLFVSKPVAGDAKPDTIDRFFNVKMNLQQGATDEQQQIAGGTAAFVGFLASDPLTIYFKKADKFQPDQGGTMTTQSGCKKLTEFKAVRANFSAAVAGAAQACTGCHAGTNGGATGALTLTNIGSADDTVVQNVCNQVLIRTNLTTPDSSGIYLAPSPTSTHPFRFTQAQLDTFKANVGVWVAAEKTAP